MSYLVKKIKNELIILKFIESEDWEIYKNFVRNKILKPLEAQILDIKTDTEKTRLLKFARNVILDMIERPANYKKLLENNLKNIKE